MNSFSTFYRQSPVTTFILILTVGIYLVPELFPSVVGQSFTMQFALYYFEHPKFHWFQIITSIFLHGGLMHLFFNMFSLYNIGPTLERMIGSTRFFSLYFLSGIFGSLLHLAITALFVYIALGRFWIYDPSLPLEAQFPNITNLNQSLDQMYPQLKHALSVSVGASGALYGVFAVFARMFPNMKFYLMFIPVAIKAKFLLIGLIAFDLILAILQLEGDPLGHFAHLGGAFTGLLFFYTLPKNLRLGFRWSH
jgi:membrane associated rhomboid family serine protease